MRLIQKLMRLQKLIQFIDISDGVARLPHPQLVNSYRTTFILKSLILEKKSLLF